MYYLGLFWWAIPAIIIYFIWYKIKKTKSPTKEPKISFLTIVFSIILTIVIISLFTLIWGDITKSALGGESSIGRLQKEERSIAQFRAILYHTGFVVPLIALALVLYFWLYKKGVKYSALVVPYLIGSIFMVLRLLSDVGIYIVEQYKRVGIYGVVIALVVVFSLIVFFVQQKWEKDKKNKGTVS